MCDALTVIGCRYWVHIMQLTHPGETPMPSMRRPFHHALVLIIGLVPLFTIGVAAQDTATPSASPVAATPVATAGQHAWVELGPDGAVIARAISAAGCPFAV